jgi:hypothetical protein
MTKEYVPSTASVPAGPIRRVVQDWLDQQDEYVFSGNNFCSNEVQPLAPRQILAFQSGVSKAAIDGLMRADHRSIHFDIADKLVCTALGEHGWHCDPELSEIYQTFNLAKLDLIEPTTPYADGYLEEIANGGSQSEIARRIGVDPTSVHRALQKRRELLAAA